MSSKKSTAPVVPTPAGKTTEQPKQSISVSKIFLSPWTYVIGLGVITILLFSSFVFNDNTLFGSDTMSNLDGRASFRTDLWEYHQIPVWFNGRLSGYPAIDAGFGDVFYPISMIAYSLFPEYRAIGIRLIFHVFLAGLFFFLLLSRGFKAPPYIAFIGAVFYMVNPQFISHVYPGHDGKMFVIAWLPYVVWRMKALMEMPTLLNSALMSVGIALMLLTGHVQMTYFVMWGLFLYWVLSLVLQWLKTKQIKSLIGIGFFFWVAVFVGIGMAFIQFYPLYAYVQDAFSVRGVDRGFDYAASWSLHWPEFVSLWVPEFGNFLDNYWSENAFKLNTEYAGVMAGMLAILAIISRPNAWRIFWGAVALLTVGYALGAHSPVFHMAYALIPGVKKFRACSMIMFWFSFAISMLASLFIFDLARERFANLEAKIKQRWLRGLLIAAAGCTVIALVFSARGFVSGLMIPLVSTLSEPQQSKIFEMNFSKNFVPFLWVWWLWAIILIGFLWAVINGNVNKYVLLSIILVIGLIDGIRVDSKFIKTTDPRPYFRTEPVLKQLALEMKSEPFRCFTLPNTLPQNGEGIHGLEGVGGFHDNELRWYRSFRGDQRDMNYFTGLIAYQGNQPYLNADKLKDGNAFLNLANAKYYLVRQGAGILPIRNQGALGRLSMTTNFIKLDTASLISSLKNNSYDIRTTVALLEEPVQKPANPISDSSIIPVSFDAKWEKYTPNYRKATINTSLDGYLRISEVFYPGWEIKVDGKKEKVYQADLAWMAVFIKKGSHSIEMIPHSLYLKKGVLVSAPLLILVCGYLILVLVIGLVSKKKTVVTTNS